MRANISKKLNIEQSAMAFFEKIIFINRVTKVTKGGKKMSFSALVVVGDRNGKAGFALGKANEVADAIKKALSKAKKSLIFIPREGTTIPHEAIAKFGASRIILKPASEGTGIIACGPIRAICEAAGIKDILTKSFKSNNPITVIQATISTLSNLKVSEEKREDESSQTNTVGNP